MKKTIILLVLLAGFASQAFSHSYWGGAGKYFNRNPTGYIHESDSPKSPLSATLYQFGHEETYFAAIDRKDQFSFLIGRNIGGFGYKDFYINYGVALVSRRTRYLGTHGQFHLNPGYNFTEDFSISWDHWSNGQRIFSPIYDQFNISVSDENDGEDYISLLWRF